MEFKLEDFERASAALINLELGPGVTGTITAALHLIREKQKREEEDRPPPSTVIIEELGPGDSSTPSPALGATNATDELPSPRPGAPIPARSPVKDAATQTDDFPAQRAGDRWDPLFLRREGTGRPYLEWEVIEDGLRELESGWETLRSFHYAACRRFDEFRQGPGRDTDLGNWPDIVARRKELVRQIAAIRRAQREPDAPTTGGEPIRAAPAETVPGPAASVRPAGQVMPSVVINIANSENCSVPINILVPQGGQGGSTGAYVTEAVPRTPRQMGLPRGNLSLSEWEGCRICHYPGVARTSRCPRQELHELIGQAYRQGVEHGTTEGAKERRRV